MNRRSSCCCKGYVYGVMLLAVTFSWRLHAFVHSSNCPDLNVDTITNLVNIELMAPVQLEQRVEGLRVNLDCSDEIGSITIEVWDPITHKDMQRTVSGIRRDGAERSVALIVSQLYKASWSELLISGGTTAESTASRVDVAAAEAVAQNTFLPAKKWMVSIGAGARKRSLGSPYITLHTQLGVGRRINRWWIFGGYLGFDMGQTDVPFGAVRFFNGALGVEPMIRFNSPLPIVFDVGGAAAITWSYFSGQADSPSLTTSSTSGFAAEAMIFGGPGFQVSDLILRVQAEVGYAQKHPTAGVGGGDTFTLGGYFLGISLRIYYGISL